MGSHWGLQEAAYGARRVDAAMIVAMRVSCATHVAAVRRSPLSHCMFRVTIGVHLTVVVCRTTSADVQCAIASAK